MKNSMIFQRYEFKYLMDDRQMQAVLAAMAPHMVPDEYSHSSMAQDQALGCVAGTQPWPDSQIGAELAYAAAFYKTLRPVVFLSYERDSYRGAEDPDFRVTFDREIRYRQEELTLDSDTWGIPILAPGQVLMELKVAGGLPLWIVHVLSEQGIFKTSFSKYGTAYEDILLRGQRGEQKYA